MWHVVQGELRSTHAVIMYKAVPPNMHMQNRPGSSACTCAAAAEQPGPAGAVLGAPFTPASLTCHVCVCNELPSDGRHRKLGGVILLTTSCHGQALSLCGMQVSGEGGGQEAGEGGRGGGRVGSAGEAVGAARAARQGVGVLVHFCSYLPF
jgi:hypothetical protein